jgi:outer membrane protein assembly factor BamB/precorrin-6B methylase 2
MTRNPEGDRLMSRRVIRLVAVIVPALALVLGGVVAWDLYADKGDGRPLGFWPQWRGPDRNSVSKETGLLKTWPENGPALAWKVTGLGSGVASVAVAGERIFTLGKVEDEERLIALEEATGKKLWSVAIGAAKKGESSLMRWLSQRTPTVDGDRVYAITANGELACLNTSDGKVLWQKSYPQDFKGRTGGWGWCDKPLVDGDRLICTPGAKNALVVALDKKTGEIVWQCENPGDYIAAYGATVVAEVGGIRQYVAVFNRAIVGVAAKDGKLLWSYKETSNGTANSYTPLVRGDFVLCTSGYSTGMALIKLIAEEDKMRVEQVWFQKLPMAAWHDGVILIGDHVYAGAGGKGLLCIELMTGKVVWEERGGVGGSVSLAAVEGNLYLLSQRGAAGLVPATPEGYSLKGRLKLPEAMAKPGATTPAIAGGRLYLRDDDRLFCYELREGAKVKPDSAKPEEKKPGDGAARRPSRPMEPDEPDAVFVTTPPEVVEKMVDLARIRPTDVVCDLGCGDGRILVAAARRHGCKAIGYDIDRECIRMARENVARNEVDRLVRIERRDLFTVDLGEVDVVMLYLSEELNERLLPQLARLKPGSRIVSHAFAIPGVLPDQVITVPSEEDDLDHTIYIWTTPLRKTQKSTSKESQ